MDTLHHRLAELADDAPVGGAPPAELWARGRRSRRLRAAAVAFAVLVVAVGAAVTARVSHDDGRQVLTPADPLGFSLPVAYPAGRELPSLGLAPGPLAAVWTDSRPGSASLTAVGLVAATGTFGTLPVDLRRDDPQAPDDSPSDVVALSPDGRRMAYWSSTGALTVRDLVSGETWSPAFDVAPRIDLAWADATHLVGHVAAGSDVDGWVWQPGEPLRRVDPHLWLEGRRGQDLWVFVGGGDPGTCSTPVTLASSTGLFNVPGLCDVLAVIGSDFALGHRRPLQDSRGDVVAVDVRGAHGYPSGSPAQQDRELEDPALRHAVVTAPAPTRVTFAAYLIGEALGVGGAS